jgi:ferredoxin
MQCDASGHEIATHRLGEGKTLVLGRAAPAAILDAADTTLSRRHLSMSLEGGRVILRDLGSRNGTFIRVDGVWPLEDGDLIWLGNQQLRLVIGDGRAAAPAVVEGAATMRVEPRPPGESTTGTAAGARVVTFGPGRAYPFGTSATLLDLALARRVRIKYDCKAGDCGKCRVEITAGAEHVNPRTLTESKALRMIGHDEPESRLACMVTEVRGPITVVIPA